ncbi:MAG TPA: protein kinase, partial [Roseiflexaceae bacterium]|nr:protein kinase [Roseiflexaceae bacterium]
MTPATTFGPYQLAEILDRGETGNLVRAHDTQLDRSVAIKIVCDALSQDAAFRAAFRQQALALKALRHAHIVEVIEAGVRDGVCYVVSAAPAGGSLRELLGRGEAAALPLAQRVALVAQAASALAFAHDNGFVHGSVTPDDFWLEREGEGYYVRLSDFGVGWLAIHSDAAADLWSDSLVYAMPPERCQGLDLDGRSDVYALGVILYELVAGMPPFRVTNLDMAVVQHVYTQPQPPSAYAADLSPELEVVILRCLAKQPDERFATAGELAEALQPFMPPLPAPAQPAPQPESSAQPAKTTELQPDDAPTPPVDVPGGAEAQETPATPEQPGMTEPQAETLAPATALCDPELVPQPETVVDQRAALQARARQNGRALQETRPAQPVAERVPQALIGTTVAGFHLGDYLGVSETGDVYRSLHPDHPGIVAVKLVGAALAADPAFADGFRQQIATVQALRHPNLVTLVDAGEADGFLYTAMEWLPDGSVRNLLQQRSAPNALPLQLAVEMARQVAVGLEFVHAQGFVHGCIKPNNLLIERRGRAAAPEYTVKIADLGLAWLALHSDIQADQIWPDTLIYAMPPERCQGLELDSRADLYALGVLLYELATGSVPFETKTLDTAVYRHVYTQPTSPRQLAPDIPQELEAIILKCLAKRPEDRYATAAELAAALQRILDSAALAPKAAPLVVAGDAPRIEGPFVPRVSAMDAYGRGLAARELTGEGLRVGRATSNDIVLKADAIAPHHLMLDWDGTSVLATNLAEGAVMVGERALGRNETLPWEWNAPLRLGPFWLRVEPAPIETAATAAMPTVALPIVSGEAAPAVPAEAAPAEASPGEVLSDRIGVVLDEQELTLMPGRPATCQVSLANIGPLVDHFTVTVEQVPAAWILGSPPMV